jgi:hypothetical protein
MSALAILESFGEEDLVFKNSKLCRHCLQNEWPLMQAVLLGGQFMYWQQGFFFKPSEFNNLEPSHPTSYGEHQVRASFYVLRRKSWELSHMIYLKLTQF